MAEKIAAIFGAGNVDSSDRIFQLAEKLGKCLAEAGFTIINGGYGGIMLASAKGAASVGGKTIGVTCTAFGRSGANQYISQEIETGSLEERLQTLVKLGQAYIILPGSTGTLLELAFVWELKNKGFINKDKPIILVGGFWKPLVDLIKGSETRSDWCIQQAADAEEAAKILKTGLR
jgi:uncharacterized protein (TIGR00730 family)